jgi:hypothetical protein
VVIIRQQDRTKNFIGHFLFPKKYCIPRPLPIFDQFFGGSLTARTDDEHSRTNDPLTVDGITQGHIGIVVAMDVAHRGKSCSQRFAGINDTNNTKRQVAKNRF